MQPTYTHTPVLLQEAVDNLVLKSSGNYIDATFGRGGHSKEILKRIDRESHLICIDKDKTAIEVAQEIADPRVIVRHGSYIHLKEWVKELKMIGKIDGILLDLGVSSPQLDDPERGFGFMQQGVLDMRMDRSQPLSAKAWINKAKEEEIATVLKDYGEERYARRIAKAIVAARKVAMIETTERLAAIVKEANPRWEEHKHPATRAFQAIRIFINNELDELQRGLEVCLDVLAVGGRLVVISFHSLEDRIVKQFIKKYETGGDIPKRVPLRRDQLIIRVKKIGRPIRADAMELQSNPRARSAVLRVMEKLI
jgi:16S rRNA (cytosine1402-N4)-methyltransferase